MEFLDRYGRMAVIAGGSEGVGAAYARLLAGRGFDLALVARSAGPLVKLAEEISSAYPGRKILTLATDLSDPQAAGRVRALTQGNDVGLLIYNAGASDRISDFVDGDLDVGLRLLAVNTATMMSLCHIYGADMKARQRGGIITVSSLASLVGNPGLAVYSGAKAFSTVFTEALWHELQPHGVDVVSHVLAATNTPSVARAFPQMAGAGDDPRDIAEQGLAALGAGPVRRTAAGDYVAGMLAQLDRGEAVRRM